MGPGLEQCLAVAGYTLEAEAHCAPLEAHLHHRDVSMQHRECQGGPVPAVGVDGGILGRVAWNLKYNKSSLFPGRRLFRADDTGTLAGYIARVAKLTEVYLHLLGNAF